MKKTQYKVTLVVSPQKGHMTLMLSTVDMDSCTWLKREILSCSSTWHNGSVQSRELEVQGSITGLD